MYMTIGKFFNILSLFTLTAFQSAAFSGRVYNDCNRNGVFDKGDKPLYGICVSDGLNVVETDREGKYELPGWDGERFVFITTPSGYYSNDGYYLPLDNTKMEGYDFGLMRYDALDKKDGSHSFIQITDTEIFNAWDHGEWVDNLRKYCEDVRPAFLIHTGDICYEYGLVHHKRMLNTENMGLPVFYCIGNHDLVDGKYGEALYEEIYGPVYYSFNVGNVHYIVTPMRCGDYVPSYDEAQVVRWMKNDLDHVKAGTPIIIFNHDRPFYGNDYTYGKGDDVISLDSLNLKAWIYGHWHMNYVKNEGKFVSICTSTVDKGGIDHSTSAYRVLHVGSDGEFVSELRYAWIDRHMTIATPLPVTATGRIPITVNTYSCVPVKSVSYSLLDDQGRKVVPDGYLTQDTDWAWTSDLDVPVKLKGQWMNLQVSAKCSNGEVISEVRRFLYGGMEEPTYTNLDDRLNLLGNPEHSMMNDGKDGICPKLAWRTNVGANVYMTAPLICGDKVIIATTDEDYRGDAAVIALDAKSGSILWKYNVRNSIKNTITADAEAVFAQDAEGWLYSISLSDGRLFWETKLDMAPLPSVIEGLVSMDGVVYAGSGLGLVAYSTENGERLWKNEGWSQNQGATSTLTIENNTLISSTQWGGLYGNDIKDGKTLWSKFEDGIRNRGSSAAGKDGLIYLMGGNNFFIINARTGSTVVKKELPFSADVTSTPLIVEDQIIFATVRNGLVSLDRETLEMKWNLPLGEGLIYSAPYSRTPAATSETSPVLWGNTVFIASSDGKIAGANIKDGNKTWIFESGAPFFATPTVSGNRMFAADMGGTIYVFFE